ncbi:hypothetical protein PAXRUDRAFT_219295 [Paxillus rubicundulus Ve08.2h10]|uniref:Uncharacterized protein n=1 Tax=Paxillus rubicundulus Ve08.2h10 TaxID=930991 RepID=A0A0D0DAA0_9AGAM|nr:hypothetical protein PAXRUDRAFT_219295 [Paxillus rubicundulus Ve08.2h10]
MLLSGLTSTVDCVSTAMANPCWGLAYPQHSGLRYVAHNCSRQQHISSRISCRRNPRGFGQPSDLESGLANPQSPHSTWSRSQRDTRTPLPLDTNRLGRAISFPLLHYGLQVT